MKNKRDFPGDHWLRFCTSNAGGTGLIPGQGTKMPHAAGQLGQCTKPEKSPCAATKKEPTDSDVKIPQAATKT